MDIERVIEEARAAAMHWQQPAWVYQLSASTAGFRFGPLPDTERGVLVAVFDIDGRATTPKALGREVDPWTNQATGYAECERGLAAIRAGS